MEAHIRQFAIYNPDYIVTFEEDDHDGFTQQDFQTVSHVFGRNLEEKLETAGASFAVYHKYKCIVNLYGGMAKTDPPTDWEEDTTSVLFSTTKSISAVILAHVLHKSEDKVTYDTKIVDIWPEFGQNGKQNITILDATLHRAGLAYVEGVVLTREDVKNHKKMSKYFEDATPMIDGKKIVYHALTFGLLLDQIVRRVDEKRRGISQILDEDFVDPFEIKNLSIGVKNPNRTSRIADLTDLTEAEIKRQGERNPEALALFMAGNNIHNQRLYRNFPWITVSDYNLLENRMLQMPSNMGISNARGLARFHSLLANKLILSKKFYELFENPVLEDVFDHGIGYDESKGYGFHYTKNPTGHWNIGHSGFGGQNVMVDIHNKLTFAYVTNGLKIEDAEMVEPWRKLVEETYRCFYDLLYD